MVFVTDNNFDKILSMYDDVEQESTAEYIKNASRGTKCVVTTAEGVLTGTYIGDEKVLHKSCSLTDKAVVISVNDQYTGKLLDSSGSKQTSWVRVPMAHVHSLRDKSYEY